MFYLGFTLGSAFSLVACGLGYLIGWRMNQVSQPERPLQSPLPKSMFKAFTRGPEKRKPKANDDAQAWKIERGERG